MTDFHSAFEEFVKSVILPEPENLQNCRRLTRKEISLLQNGGSYSIDWNTVLISPDTNLDLIRNCVFQGRVLIHLPEGKLQSTRIRNCSLSGPLSIDSTGLISGMTLYPGSSVSFCGKVEWTSDPSFLESFIQGGLETGERSVPLFPALTHLQAAWLASGDGRAEAEGLAALLLGLKGRVKGFIGAGAILDSCPAVENSLLLEGAKITSATAVRGSILFPGSTVSDGALVRSSVLQWNAKTDSMAVVENSIVGECSIVEKHGKLSSSYLGADSVLGEGEITASIVGPLTGMHHQSLLIAALWPGGRGNIGYGANIGSNHTSRLPDQEIRPGTGLFFGLSTSVKFPSDFSRSPFSVIATGLTTLPQRVEFPFSLICLPAVRPEGIPEGWMRLVPGWMLHSNLYAVLRSLWKFRNRSRAVHTHVEADVFTDDVLKMVNESLKDLESTSGHTAEGAGKNFITQEDRLAGIEVYRKCLRYFALVEGLSKGTLTTGESGELLDLVRQVRRAVRESRAKDLGRGRKIINDYETIHPTLEEDPFMIVFEEKVLEMERELSL